MTGLVSLAKRPFLIMERNSIFEPKFLESDSHGIRQKNLYQEIQHKKLNQMTNFGRERSLHEKTNFSEFNLDMIDMVVGLLPSIVSIRIFLNRAWMHFPA